MVSNKLQGLGMQNQTSTHQQGFKKGTEDRNLYIKTNEEKKLIVFVYIDDINSSGDDDICKMVDEEMHKQFEMSMLGELSLFLGLQIIQ